MLSPAINTGGSFTLAAYLDATGNFDPLVADVGIHRVYYSFTDGKGCSNTDSIDIEVYDLPDASITPTGPFCLNAGMQTILPAVNAGGSFTFNTFIDASGNFDPAAAGVGTHRIYYTFNDGIGCSNTDSLDVLVWSLPDASILDAGPFCSNDAVSSISPSTPGGSFSGGAFISATGDFDPSLGNITDNWVYYALTDANACSNIDSTLIIVNDIPNNTITLNPNEGCDPLEIDYFTEPADSIVWTLGPEITIDQTNVQSVLTTGSYQLVLEAFNALGCSTTTTENILVHPTPNASFSFSPDVVYLDNPTYYFNDESSPNITGWEWQFGDGNSSIDSDPAHTYSAGGEYSVDLFVEDVNGCRDTTSNVVFVRDNLVVFIPTAFSPNSSGLNDVFRVSGVGYTNIDCRIYNRWGEKLFDSDNFTQWDGTYKGEIVQNGVYIYQMTLTDYAGRRYHRKGTVNVVR